MESFCQGDIVIFHVGGSLGSYGPIDVIIDMVPKKCVVYEFEARKEETDLTIQSRVTSKGVRLNTVNAYIGEFEGELQDFYVNTHPESSSAFLPNPEVAEEICPLPYTDDVPTWGANTKLKQKEQFVTRNLKSIIEEIGIVPDVLSIDAQGAELSILKGTGKYLKDILVLITEVEFFEIYVEQGLYQDQAKVLQNNGFRLADIYNKQVWHPTITWGNGYLTVGEALWFKRLSQLQENIISGIKFAVIANGFGYHSTAFLIMDKIKKIDSEEVDKLCCEFGYGSLLKTYEQGKLFHEQTQRSWSHLKWRRYD